MGVGPPSVDYGFGVTKVTWHGEHLEEVDSTNSWLARRAREGAGEGEVVFADYQSAGRGRLAREWTAPARSSLLCSVLLGPPANSDNPQWFVVAAALAMGEALGRLTGSRPQLKWPNDLLYGDEKVSGLLAEVVGTQIVVGLGVNLTAVDPGYPSATTVLEVSGVALAPRDVLSVYLEALASRRELLDSPAGRVRVRDEFVENLSTLGRSVRAELSSEVVRGRAVGVDETGSLLIDTGDGVRAVSAGDVVHLRGEE